MSAKSKSPEAAQKKLWKAELKTLGANRRKVQKDFANEDARLTREFQQTIKASEAAKKQLHRFHAKAAKAMPAALRNIERRIAILNGRLGL